MKIRMLALAIAATLLSGISAEAAKKCLLIGAADGAENAEFDKYIIPRLQAWGYVVEKRVSTDIPNLKDSDYAPYDFIFLSETTHSSHMPPLRTIPKPMLCSDGWGAKESSLAFGAGEPVGILEPSQPIVFLDGAKGHLIAGGHAPGAVVDLATVEQEPQRALLVWGKPTIPVIAIAGVKSDPTQLAVYGIEKGTVNAKGETIKNRVVVIGTHAWGYDDLTADGEKVFKGAIDWLLAVTLSATDLAKLEADIGLTPAQNSEVSTLLAKLKSSRREVKEDASLSPEEKKKKIGAANEAIFGKIKALMTPEQYAKWEKLQAAIRAARA